jgi:hypothetical protein
MRKTTLEGDKEPRNLFTIVFGSLPETKDRIRYALIVNLSEQRIRAVISDAASYSTLFILDKDRRFLSHPKPEFFGTAAEKDGRFTQILQSPTLRGAKTILGEDGERWIATWEDHPELPWRFVTLASEKTVFSPLFRVRNRVVITAGALLGIVLSVASHYPHDARFARIADEEGVLLWEEIPVYWAIAFTNPDTYADAENQLSELVQRDRNRASVIIWSAGNENADTDSRFSFMARLVEKARVLDGTRPVSAACLINTTKLAIEDRLAEVLDIIGVNEYYGWYDPDFEKLARILENSNPRKPVILCEFGGGARAGHRGTEEDLFSEDRQEWIYKRQLDLISSCPYIQGMSPWILYDFRCPRRLNRYQELFNRKGLIDSDRKTKKRAFCLLSTFYRDIKK